MVAPRSGRQNKAPYQNDQKTLKRKREGENLKDLARKVEELDPRVGVATFAELPLSQPTTSGLEASHFKNLTDIQKKAVPLALKGSDILGAAKTGSGKTLAFLIPVLENLVRKKWTEHDGLGALILSPTRELAIQIFEVLRKVGRHHTFSAGLVIGGKSLHEERERLGRMNILVCTPGRMLQHMDQTSEFEIGNLQMLVLDEADRIMDMGFQGTVDAIIEHLPKERQTLLFSATQTRKVGDLARLSLKEPEYVSVHEAASSATPSTLQQHYVITPLPEKLDTLWSFIRANLKAKILVFLSSGKQVRFVYEGLRHLQPGLPLLHLHGRQKQTARLDITRKFASTKNSCLFATDVVARGLDFPAVDWVIQFDCPEDADTYIHRVGRTARYEREGRAVLFLDPSENTFIQRLEHKKVPIEEIKVRSKKQQSVKTQLQNMCFKDPELKYLGQKAFVSYVRSVHLQRDKEVFKVKELPLEEYSASLGLPGAPKIKFQTGESYQESKKRKNAPRQALSSSEDEADDAEKPGEKKDTTRTKYDRMFERRNQDVLAGHYSSLIDHGEVAAAHTGDADADDTFLTVKRRLSSASSESETSDSATLVPESPQIKSVQVAGGLQMLIDSKRREKLLKSKKAMLRLKGKGNKLVFDDNGNPHEVYELQDEDQFKSRGPADEQRVRFVEEEAERIKAADVDDKRLVKDKRREKKEKRKAREAMEDGSGDEAGPVAELVPFGGEEDESAAPPAKKRAKKWFEDDSDAEEKNSKKKGKGAVEAAETLEDLEALAASYL